jgi:phage tail sheath protein FI
MSVQVTYPGVYIEEFTPGAPIQGVGTSTAAFIGTVTQEPPSAPVLVQSWDAFVSRFGGIAAGSRNYLAPAVYGFFLNGGTACYIVHGAEGDLKDGTKATAVVDQLKPYDDVALVCAPGLTGKEIQSALITHCDGTMKDRFAILDAPEDATPDDEAATGILKHLEGVKSDSGFAALYYPWIAVGSDTYWPPSGHIAGIYARTDAERGVHKAPANATVRGAVGVKRRLTDAEQGLLNPKGVNVLRVFTGQATPLVWGARTTSSDTNWQYVNIRRLFIFLERSIQEGIRWALFEPNNLQLWQKAKRTITEFLTRVWRDGALFGATPEEAFYVRIDGVLNPPAEQKLGRLNMEVGVRPTYTAEFIVVRIGIWDGGAEVKE